MSWIPVVFNLCVGLLFAAYLLHAVRRFERRADKIMDNLDRRHEERMRRLEALYAEMKTEMHETVDRMIAESQAQIDRANAEIQELANHQAGAADAPSETESLPH